MLAVAFCGPQFVIVPAGLFGGSLVSAGFDGATLSVLLLIQEVTFLTAWFRLDAVSGWDVLRASVHWLSDTLLQLRSGVLGAVAGGC